MCSACCLVKMSSRFFAKCFTQTAFGFSVKSTPKQFSIHTRFQNFWEGSYLHNNDNNNNIWRSWDVTSDVPGSQGIEPGKQQQQEEDGEGKNFYFATNFDFQREAFILANLLIIFLRLWCILLCFSKTQF